jgi:hypothetical protein
MKTMHLAFFLCFAAFVLSCTREPKSGLSQVEAFIHTLKQDSYTGFDLPDLDTDDIAELLKYVDEDSRVTKFPNYLISSYVPQNPDYTVGVIVLWTIESIRVSSFKESDVLLFPSQHPFVRSRSSDIWFENHNDQVYEMVKEAYLSWWETHENLELAEFHHIDPLANADVLWH